MAWREALLNHVGPGLLGGITFSDWIKVLRENHFAVSPRCVLRAATITQQSLQNSAWARYEHRRYGRLVAEVEIPPPVFVLGHFRSGTTHLHNLLTVDERFAFPNTFQSLYPHTFLSVEPLSSRLMGYFLPKNRPMDNVAWDMKSPQEDEFALAVASLKSSYIGWVFPERQEHYDQYLTFRGASDQDILEWQRAFLWFARKLAWKYRRPLVLKSPPHTCRIKLLLEMFPGARFVHIRREPYVVFQSSRHTFQKIFGWQRLHHAGIEDFDGWVLRQFRDMYDVFFEERHLIPEGQFHELSFEELERDPMGEVRRVYEALNLPDFSQVEPKLQAYVDSLAGYQKNQFVDLPDNLRERIAREWRRCFEEWGYAV